MAHVEPLECSHLPQFAQMLDRYDRIRRFLPNSILTMALARAAAQVPCAAEQKHFDALRQNFNDAEIVEIVAAIALFGYLNRWNDTMATGIEAYPASVAERAVGPVGWSAGKHQTAGDPQ